MDKNKAKVVVDFVCANAPCSFADICVGLAPQNFGQEELLAIVDALRGCNVLSFDAQNCEKGYGMGSKALDEVEC